jgi:polyhydroxybutyrate depolymerase
MHVPDGSRFGPLLAAVCALGITACAHLRPIDPAAPVPGDYDEALHHETDRSYRLHIPATYSAARQWPLVVVLHGAFSSGPWTEELTDFDRIADREGFVVAYPNATDRPVGLFQLWNAGHCCGKQVSDKVDDVGFIGAVLSDVETKVRIDPQRKYVVGYSNGGMLAYVVAAQYGDRLAAVGILSGNMSGHGSLDDPTLDVPPSHPVSIMAVHGMADTHVPYAGAVHDDGIEVPFEVNGTLWAKADHCLGAAPSHEAWRGAVIVQRFGPCPGGAEVELLSVKGWKHEYLGGKRTRELPPDHPLHDFDVAELFWSFFERHRRPVAPFGKR